MKWSFAAVGALSLARGVRSQFLVEPDTTADPNTIKDCTWWHVVASGDTCALIESSYSVTHQQFTTYNPSLASTCSLVLGNSYCIEQNWGQPPASGTPTTSTSAKTTSTTFTTQSSTFTTRSSTTTTSTSTTTVPGNGVTTPVPTQSGMVGNCNKFHWVEKEQGCATIAALYSISTAQFLQWNPAAKSDCSGLWALTYACVGIIGTPASTTATPTKTGNGVVTPTPIQPGMIANCNKFFFVNPGDTCDSVAFWGGAPGTQWVKLWNPAVGSDCKNLQAKTYACVGLISGNGIATPTPIQPGMVGNCNKFVRVNPGDTCDRVAFFNGPIATEQFVQWNTGVGGMACNKLQAGTYACVGVL